MNNACKICGNQIDNKFFKIKERRINKGDEFEYMLCSNCGVLALNEYVKNMYKYYSDNYYSFRVKKFRLLDMKNQLRKIVYRGIIAGVFSKQLADWFFNHWMGYAQCLYGSKLKPDVDILDVGGGSGEWLRRLREIGFKNLTNVDLYAEQPEDNTGIKYIKGTILDVPSDRKYDLITLHHSFEHMDNPDEVLHCCSMHLKEKGLLIIRIPIMGKQAWKIYGTNWYQIDAPRHLFLYTEKAMKILTERNNLLISKIIYDSRANQMKVSEMYRDSSRGFGEFDKKTLKRADYRMAKKLNDTQEGDQAIFYLSRKC